jgi:hypothetical protein
LFPVIPFPQKPDSWILDLLRIYEFL